MIKKEEQIQGALLLQIFKQVSNEFNDVHFVFDDVSSRNIYKLKFLVKNSTIDMRGITIGLMIKSSNKRITPWRYTFLREHQDDLLDLYNQSDQTFVVFAAEMDGVACLTFEELKRLLDDRHDDQEWVSVSRRRNEAYRVSGSDGNKEKLIITRNSFPSKITDYLLTQ